MSNALYVAWRSGDATQGRWGPVGRLERLGTEYRFAYTKGARSLKGFQAVPEMPHLDKVYESEELFPLFANRLLSKSRPEYEAYLTWGGFDPDNPPDPIAILGVTEGRRATDSLSAASAARASIHAFMTGMVSRMTLWGGSGGKSYGVLGSNGAIISVVF